MEREAKGSPVVMGVKKKHQGKKGGRKIGHNKKKCDRYRAEGRREKNKARKIKKDAKRRKRS